jgi:uncharacterized RDD family membrane protein YckC
MSTQGEGVLERPWSARSAPLFRRALARLIDFGVGILMLVGLMLALAALGHAQVDQAREDRLDGTGIFVLSALLTFLLYLVYEVGLVGRWGRTLGKVALGLRVERVADGGRPGLLRSFLRNLIPAAALIAFFPAYPLAWMVAPLGRANDRLAGTRVVTSAGGHT